jgi:hypothetical protein
MKAVEKKMQEKEDILYWVNYIFEVGTNDLNSL